MRTASPRFAQGARIAEIGAPVGRDLVQAVGAITARLRQDLETL